MSPVIDNRNVGAAHPSHPAWIRAQSFFDYLKPVGSVSADVDTASSSHVAPMPMLNGGFTFNDSSKLRARSEEGL